jgi:hypothetical protein
MLLVIRRIAVFTLVTTLASLIIIAICMIAQSSASFETDYSEVFFYLVFLGIVFTGQSFVGGAVLTLFASTRFGGDATQGKLGRFACGGIAASWYLIFVTFVGFFLKEVRWEMLAISILQFIVGGVVARYFLLFENNGVRSAIRTRPQQ